MNPWKLTTLVLATALALVFAFGAFSPASARAPQVHMKSALKYLQSANAELAKATADKGGHRARAIELTAEAIGQVQKGIAYDNAN
jgi:Spy/CpxP family protein refolding chaperone